ncbi:Mphosph9 [Phodopus roborovskii]|uniref:Mphosph9 protein n=1 Tax=Phodopus roborovskii TaxID=109678 RepID=A0AAV0A500_PHORO|nr:Mphosph9 [Phodopus roborovskii]
MEDFDLVKTLQKISPSVDSDIRSTPHSLGLSLCANRPGGCSCSVWLSDGARSRLSPSRNSSTGRSSASRRR